MSALYHIPLTSKWNPAPPLHYHTCTTPHYLWIPLTCEGMQYRVDIQDLSSSTTPPHVHYSSPLLFIFYFYLFSWTHLNHPDSIIFPTPHFTLFSFFFSLSHISLNLFFSSRSCQYFKSSSHSEAQSSQLLQIRFSHSKFCKFVIFIPHFPSLNSSSSSFSFLFFIPSLKPIPHKVNVSSLFELQLQTKNQKRIYLKFLELM